MPAIPANTLSFDKVIVCDLLGAQNRNRDHRELFCGNLRYLFDRSRISVCCFDLCVATNLDRPFDDVAIKIGG